MTNLETLLAELNALRIANDKKPMKSWKNSIAELKQRILDESPSIVVPASSGVVSPDLADIISKSNVEVTQMPMTSPELKGAAKRKAIIETIADKSVKDDVPTTLIDAKAASRTIRRATIKAKAQETRDATKTATKKPSIAVPAKKAKAKVAASPKSTSDFAAHLASIGMDAKVARAKLRRANFSAPYKVTAELKAALAADSRKK